MSSSGPKSSSKSPNFQNFNLTTNFLHDTVCSLVEFAVFVKHFRFYCSMSGFMLYTCRFNPIDRKSGCCLDSASSSHRDLFPVPPLVIRCDPSDYLLARSPHHLGVCIPARGFVTICENYIHSLTQSSKPSFFNNFNVKRCCSGEERAQCLCIY